MQGSVQRTKPKALGKPSAKGAPLPPGTDLEPSRAGKDPDRRPEETLEGTARRSRGRGKEEPGSREAETREAGVRILLGRWPLFCSSPVQHTPYARGGLQATRRALSSSAWRRAWGQWWRVLTF